MTFPAPAQDIDLTSRQKAVLRVFVQFEDERGYPPTLREVISNTDITSTSVARYHIDQLADLGLIEITRGPHSARRHRLTGGRYLVPADTRRLAGL